MALLTASLRRCFSTAPASPLAPLLSTPTALDAPVHAAVLSYLALPPHQQATALSALYAASCPPLPQPLPAAAAAAAAAAPLARAAAASPLALPFLASVRRGCSSFEGGALSPWAAALDAAALAVLRPLYGPALTPLQRLQLPPPQPPPLPRAGAADAPQPPWMRALVASAQRSESVRPTADAQEFARKFGWRRLVYGLHHVAQPEELLAVLYAALLPRMPTGMAAVEALSGGSAPAAAAAAAAAAAPPPTTAAFYSVGSPASAARGLRLGSRIIFALAGELARPGALPHPPPTTFCTLSPVPGFVPWLRGVLEPGAGGVAAAQRLALEGALEGCAERGAAAAALAALAAPASKSGSLAQGLLLRLQTPQWWEAQGAGAEAVRALAAVALQAYLLRTPAPGAAGGPLCKVAAFHLGNGAQLGRVCGGGDASAAGLARSGGFMVNYVYSQSGAEGLAATQLVRAREFAACPAAVLQAQRPSVQWSFAGDEHAL